MSRQAKPGPNGEPPSHRIQYILDHVEWQMVQKLLRPNGVRTMAGLVGVLLSRECERLGVTEKAVVEAEAEARAVTKKTRRKKARRT